MSENVQQRLHDGLDLTGDETDRAHRRVHQNGVAAGEPERSQIGGE